MPSVRVSHISTTTTSSAAVWHSIIQPKLAEAHPIRIPRPDWLSHRSRTEPAHIPHTTHPSISSRRHPELRLSLPLSRLIPSSQLRVHGEPTRLLLLLLLGRSLIRHPSGQAHPIRSRLIRLVHPHRPIPTRIEPVPRRASGVAHPSRIVHRG
jgi:hypothetical protein